MKAQSQSLVLLAGLILLVFIASKPSQQTFDKISVREFELLDKNGVQRASIKTEDDGEVVLRLKDRTGTIRLKLGANENGSGLLLLDSNTEPGIHALSKENGSTLTIIGKDKKKKEF